MERVGKEKRVGKKSKGSRLEEIRKQVGRKNGADWKRKMKGMEEKSGENGREM